MEITKIKLLIENVYRQTTKADEEGCSGESFLLLKAIEFLAEAVEGLIENNAAYANIISDNEGLKRLVKEITRIQNERI